MNDAQPVPVLSPAPMPHASHPPRPRRSCLGCIFGLFAVLSLGFFLLMGVAFLAVVLGFFGGTPDNRLREKHHSGNAAAKDKIAIIEIDGVIFEGAIGYPKKQIEQAAEDDQVKAVVLRIDSPGGSITASDELHRRISELVNGKDGKASKPAVVSMGALAASGGYYVAMPVKTLYAERTTITGSIGVFASFPNVKELGDKIGFKMETIKAGDVKDSGSPFKDMTPQERQLWQDMVDHAYEQFLEIVREGRPKIKDELRTVVISKTIKVKVRDPKTGMETGEEKEEPFTRTRVDGGIFTADQAKQFGLIDRIGYLEDAIKDVATTAGLGTDYQVVAYEKPVTLASLLLGVQAPKPGGQLDSNLSSAAMPRLWYLAPQSELAGILTAAGK